MPVIRSSAFCRRSAPRRLAILVSPTTISNRLLFKDPSFGFASPQVFLSLSLQEGDFVVVFRGSKRVALRLKLLGNDCTGDTNQEMADSVLYVAPVVIANLGLFHGSEKVGSITSDPGCFLETIFEQPSPAASVVLSPLGRPANGWPRFFGCNGQEEEAWVFPRANSLVQPTNLVSVYDQKSQSTFYYQVLDATPKGDSITGPADFLQISSSTEFVLDRSPVGKVVRRLPPLLDFSHESQQMIPLPPHPNLSELILWFDHPASSPKETVLHVIGNEPNHHVRMAVETAAHLSGMQCLSIRGLAAFAHQQGNEIRSGSLADQLAGFQAAVRYIRRRRMEPCVLHIYDFDTELSCIDQPMRHEQEERFWSKWMAMATSKTTSSPRPGEQQDSDPTDADGRGNFLASSLFLVLSTPSPLKPGPLMENLVFPSIQLDLPNLAYAKYLWDGAPWNDEMGALLPGRAAREILELRRKALCSLPSDGNEQDTSDMIRELCDKLDEERREKSSNLAKVSNVHWEDVGGLAHVRREIMDAIELPLKHPHLFPKGGGRSGILLYGPPGTGKTLVAKAVATECGLPFMSVKGPELLGSYVGESEANIRQIFTSARQAAVKNAPTAACILFFDELDSLAPRRGGVGDGGGVMERVVATLFAELDGSHDTTADSGRVFVMGATNRPDLLDPSLLRSGRFDRLVYLGIPTDSSERARVLAAQIRKLRLEGDANELARAVVVDLPDGLTGADMSTIASGALLKAVHRLCRRADEEQKVKQAKECTQVSIDQIIESWDEDSKTPVVCLADLQAAAKNVSPSVSENEIRHYERLREEFSNTGDTTATEHDGDVFYD